MTGRALKCFGYSRQESQPDGFAEFYGYAEAESNEVPEVKPLDAFQEWYGYTDDLSEVTSTVTMYLPDRDPEEKSSSRQLDTVPGQRLEVEATEMSLALIKSEIQEKKRSLSCANDSSEVEELQHEIHELKLQQARLASALWSLQS